MHKTLLLSLLLLGYLPIVAQDNGALVLPGSKNDLNTVATAPAKLKRMATAGWDNEVLIYQADSPYQMVQKLTGHAAQINAIAYNLQGNIFASGSGDMTVRLYDSMYRQIPMKDDPALRHLDAVTALVFDRTGRFLFSGDKNGRLMIWDVNLKAPVKFYETGSSINDISLANNSTHLFVAGSDRQIKVIALAGGKTIRTLDGHTDMVNKVVLSPNNQYLLSGASDKTARLWDLRTWKQQLLVQTESWKVTAMAFTTDSKYFVIGCNDGAIQLYETETGKLISKSNYPELYVRDIAFSPDQKKLYVAGKIREGEHYGLHLIPSMIPVPVPAVLPVKPMTLAQRALDSIMKVRPLNRMDSVKYKNVLMTAPRVKQSNEGKTVPATPDTPVIYKTPMGNLPKKK